MNPEFLRAIAAWSPAAVAATLAIIRSVGALLKVRRLRRFGDATVLGVAGSIPRTLASILLFAVGGWMIGGMLFPERSQLDSTPPLTLVFCVDPDAFHSDVGSLRAQDTRALQLLHAVSAVGKGLLGVPVGAVVPTGTGVRQIGASPDADGVAVRLRSLWPETSEQLGTSEPQADLWFSGRPEIPSSAQAVCLLTFRSPAGIPQVEPTTTKGPRRYAVRIGVGLGDRSYFAVSDNGNWVELPGLLSLCSAVRSSAPRPANMTATRNPELLAVLAFAALTGEWLLGAVHRRRNKGTGARIGSIAVYLGVLLAAPPVLSASARRYVSEVAPGVALITDLSEEQPRVGEQFAVVYYLRLAVPVRAVDVDPQSFTGLWTQPVPVPEDIGSRRSGSSEFLLRQVVAWPLAEGSILLPPLRLRIQSAQSTTWDLLKTSESITVTARGVPSADSGSAPFPLVGDLTGRIEPWGPGSQEWLLELEGSALVAALDPTQWLAEAAGKPVVASPVEVEDTTRQIVDNGRRSVSVLQRRRWLAAAADGGSVDFGHTLALRVFRTGRSQWELASIKVVGRKEAPVSGLGPDVSRTERHDRAERWRPGNRPLLAAALVSLAVLAAAALAFFRRRQGNRTWVRRG